MERYDVQKTIYHIQQANDGISQEDSFVQAYKATSVDFRKMETIRIKVSLGKKKKDLSVFLKCLHKVEIGYFDNEKSRTDGKQKLSDKQNAQQGIRYNHNILFRYVLTRINIALCKYICIYLYIFIFFIYSRFIYLHYFNFKGGETQDNIVI